MTIDDPATQAPPCTTLAEVTAAVTACRACPRLVEWREEVGRSKRAAYDHEEYWARPVPGWGDERATVAVVGLAPGAHGANRTGRMFTGDRSGDWLYRAMHNAGFASQPESTGRDDGLQLIGAWVTGAGRCAPPGNKPTTAELATCRPWLTRELELLAPTLRAIVCLGSIAYAATWRALGDLNVSLPRPRPAFGHGVTIPIDGAATIICSYHPSQQNTFTGRLTEPMLDDVFAQAVELARP